MRFPGDLGCRELTPDKKDFIITYVVEEGRATNSADVTVDFDIRSTTCARATRR